MDPTVVDTIVQEAQVLGRYAVRAGRLPENSRLFTEIESVTQARSRGENPSVAPLLAEMMSASKAARVTVAQLMRRETARGRLSHWTALATPFVVGFMTLLLTLYLAFQSSELHKADLALREYQDLVGERPQEKLYLAWKMYKYESVLNVKGPPLAQLDGYQKLVDDSRRLFAKRSAVLILLSDAQDIRYVPQIFQEHGPCWLQNLALTLNSARRDEFRPSACEAAPLPAPGGPMEAGLREAPAVVIDCPVARLPFGATSKPAKAESNFDLIDYMTSIDCFMRSLRITNDYDEPVDLPIYATRNKVHLLMSWLLPGLYGLLGACVYVMRSLLHGSGSIKAGGDARIVEMLSLALRVSLGGLAGIIIGWFSLPTAPTASSAAISISSIPFGMAFLAGFSIESLFALLDRLNKSVGQRDEKLSHGTLKEPPEQG
ncbi:MAG: hypothetical protein JWR68_1637 [Polaromonas sp.]|nr:hypothetical protein [Polaromonas sp.]